MLAELQLSLNDVRLLTVLGMAALWLLALLEDKLRPAPPAVPSPIPS